MIELCNGALKQPHCKFKCGVRRGTSRGTEEGRSSPVQSSPGTQNGIAQTHRGKRQQFCCKGSEALAGAPCSCPSPRCRGYGVCISTAMRLEAYSHNDSTLLKWKINLIWEGKRVSKYCCGGGYDTEWEVTPAPLCELAACRIALLTSVPLQSHSPTAIQNHTAAPAKEPSSAQRSRVHLLPASPFGHSLLEATQSSVQGWRVPSWISAFGEKYFSFLFSGYTEESLRQCSGSPALITDTGWGKSQHIIFLFSVFIKPHCFLNINTISSRQHPSSWLPDVFEVPHCWVISATKGDDGDPKEKEGEQRINC